MKLDLSKEKIKMMWKDMYHLYIRTENNNVRITKEQAIQIYNKVKKDKAQLKHIGGTIE